METPTSSVISSLFGVASALCADSSSHRLDATQIQDTARSRAPLTSAYPSRRLPRLMAEPKENPLMEKIVSLCKRRGFIFQSSEIYGGINGFWDYGPLGAELKRNVKELWWRGMTQQREDVVGLEASIIMHPKIWEASGHTSTFSDPMCDCLLTKKRFRADQIEPQSGIEYRYLGAVDGMAAREISKRPLAEGHPLPISEEVPLSLIEERLREYVQSNDKFLDRFLSDDASANLVLKAIIDRFQREDKTLGLTKEEYVILVEEGRKPGVANQAARQYYKRLGLSDPLLLERKTRK